MRPVNYLSGYPPELVAQVARLISQGKLADWLQGRHPQAHDVRTDRALYDYVQTLKSEHLRSAGPLSKVVYDGKLHIVRQALGTHTSVARVQGRNLKTKCEIRVAALFKAMPEAYLRMIVVHELAHMRVQAHDKAFYQLCSHMEPEYGQLEFELRAYLTYLEAGGAPLWG
jgi:predicted metal-dependent hydrolase